MGVFHMHVRPVSVSRVGALLCALLVALVTVTRSAGIQYQAVGTSAMVASAHSLATQAGIDILKKVSGS
jgi:hypothetical protein